MINSDAYSLLNLKDLTTRATVIGSLTTMKRRSHKCKGDRGNNTNWCTQRLPSKTLIILNPLKR